MTEKLADNPYIGLAADRSMSVGSDDRAASALAQVREAIEAMADVLDLSRAAPRSADVAPQRVRTVRHIIRVREARDREFGSDLFFDPSWDILLDAYASALEGRELCISDACLASRSPDTTALRWIKILEARGLLTRTADLNDRRRTMIAITPLAMTAMERLIDQATSTIARLS